MNIADFLSESAAKRPHGIAAITKSRALSFEALEHAVWQIAMEMHQAGIGPGDAVGMLFQHQLDYLAASLAMIRIGAIQIGFSTNSTAHTLQDLSARAGIKAFLTDIPGFKSPKLPTHRPILNSFLLKTEPLDPGIRHVDVNAPYLLISGSGTTGTPKLIAVSTATYLDIKPRDDATRPMLPGERQFSPSAINFYTAHRRCLNGIAAGATSVFRDDVEPIFSICDFFAVDHLSLVPLFADNMLANLAPDARAYRLPDLKSTLIGGSPVSEELRHKFRERISPHLTVVYGANEYGETTAAPPAMQDMHPGCVGAPCPGVTLEIVNAADEALPPGEVGLVRIKTGNVFSGYVGDAEATADALRNGWYYPGDLGLLTKDNVLVFKGRADDMMIYNGINIYPREIEVILESHPAVIEAAAFPLPSRINHHVPVAAVSLRSATGEAELIAYCQARIGALAPRHILIIDALPRNAAGKILKRELAGYFTPAPTTT